MQARAVISDLGGVVIGTPLHAATYEREKMRSIKGGSAPISS